MSEAPEQAWARFERAAGRARLALQGNESRLVAAVLSAVAEALEAVARAAGEGRWNETWPTDARGGLGVVCVSRYQRAELASLSYSAASRDRFCDFSVTVAS